MSKRIEAFETTPLSQFLFDSYRYELVEGDANKAKELHIKNENEIWEFFGAHDQFLNKSGKEISLVQFAKLALGRQDYTWVGYERNWVWERKQWRLFVSNKRGLSLEFKKGISYEEFRENWDDVRARLGVFNMFPAGTSVKAYQNDDATSLGPDIQPGFFLVELNGNVLSIHLDNLSKE